MTRAYRLPALLLVASLVAACGASPTAMPEQTLSGPPSVSPHADVVLHAADARRTVTVRPGQLVAVALGSLSAGPPFISSWHSAKGTPGPVLQVTAGGFRAVGRGDAVLLATRPCEGTGCAAAIAWTATVSVR